MSTNKKRIKLSRDPAEVGASLVIALNELREPAVQPGFDRVSLDEGKQWSYSVSAPKAKGRIIELIRLILDFERMVRENQDPKLDLRGELLWRPPKQMVSMDKKLNRMLSAYRVSPSVGASIRTGTLEWDLENAGRRTNGELQMAEWAMELSKSGFLNRVRLCRCGQWFFAHRRDSFTCSSACRKHDYENTQERIEKRRENARKYYWLHKSGKVK